MATFEKIGSNQMKFNITVDAQTFDQGLIEAYRKTRGRYQVPGFRKGKAPRKMIESFYGEAAFYEDAFDRVYWDAYVKAVEEANATPVDSPNISIEQIGSGQDLLYTATVFVKPDVIVPDEAYKSIEIEKIEYTVTSDQVKARIETEREKLVRYVDVDRAVENGDRVTLDYAGRVGENYFEGGTAQNQSLDIGAGRFIPGFEEKIIGMKDGEEKDINVTFPEEYQATELAGKEAIFSIKVHEVKVKELPELDDDFAKDVSEFDTFAEYEADIRKTLETEAKQRQDSAQRQKAIEALVKNVEIDVPTAMIERQIDRQVDNFRYQLAGQGIKIENYLEILGMDADTMRMQMRPQADEKVRADLILEAIVKQDNVTVEDDELEKEIVSISESIQKTVDETKKMLTDKDIEAIKLDLASAKVLTNIIENAILIEKAADSPDEAENKEK